MMYPYYSDRRGPRRGFFVPRMHSGFLLTRYGETIRRGGGKP